MPAPHTQFLQALFGDKPDGDRILIWTLPQKISAWFTDYREASLAVTAMVDRPVDVYFGLGLAPSDMGPDARCAADQITGITTLWADIDFQWEGAKKGKALPPSEADARKILDGIGPQPSIVVHSGHGLQAYWRLKEPWIFTGPEDRMKAQAALARWGAHIKAVGQDVGGWAVDSVWDLSRVFRVPGTTNRKDPDHPVPVTLEHLDGSRTLDYTIEDLVELLPDVDQANGQKGDSQAVDGPGGPLKLSPGARPPFELFEALCEVEPRFKMSWERQRKNLADTSASGYDFSLAGLAAGAGWDDQAVVDLLIASRRKHGDDLKLREDYYHRTIQRARHKLSADRVEEVATEIEALPTSEARKDAKLEYLSNTFKIDIQRIVRYNTRIPQYRIETASGSIHCGGVENLIEQQKIRRVLANAGRTVITPFKPAKWNEVANMIIQVCEDVDVGEDATERGEVESWVESYTEARPPQSNADEAAETKQPFIKDDLVHFSEDDLYRFLTANMGEKMSRNDLRYRLNAAGLKKRKVHVRLGGAGPGSSRTTRRVWYMPSLNGEGGSETGGDGSP